MGGGYLPSNTAQSLAVGAAFVSAINIGGGFAITKRMLDMFRRPNDPKDYNYLFAIPAGVLGATCTYGTLNDFHEIHAISGLAAALCCIGALSALSAQTTARIGNPLGMLGVGGGLLATLQYLNPDVETLAQMSVVLGSGALVGGAIASRIQVTDLPQLVALFHSFVGIAATTTCVANFLVEYPHFIADPSGAMAIKTALFLGAYIGGVTFTGSLMAYAKLQGLIRSAPVHLPARHLINASLLLANVSAMGVYLGSESELMGLSMLALTTVLSSLMGVTLTAAIGGKSGFRFDFEAIPAFIRRTTNLCCNRILRGLQFEVRTCQ